MPLACVATDQHYLLNWQRLHPVGAADAHGQQAHLMQPTDHAARTA